MIKIRYIPQSKHRYPDMQLGDYKRKNGTTYILVTKFNNLDKK
jgi:hypothetical protein